LTTIASPGRTIDVGEGRPFCVVAERVALARRIRTTLETIRAMQAAFLVEARAVGLSAAIMDTRAAAAMAVAGDPKEQG
jgi:hypothetical protein